MRRFVDILVSVAALVLLSPVLILAALAVVLSSSGSPFYRGWRVGIDGKPFRMWKFRTMQQRSDIHGSITGPNDPRVFPLGRILRRTKIDELPQFINVLTGDMTLVGPRPESPEMVAFYNSWRRTVLAVKPGITGPVQIGVGEESDLIPVGVDPAEFYVARLMDYKLQIDLDYMATRTVWSDMKVVLSTVGLILHAAFGFPWAPKRPMPPSLCNETSKP